MALVLGHHRPVHIKKSILLIQSAETQGNGTKRHLEESGHEVFWAGSGLSALMMTAKKTMDLIILDVALPDIEGLDLCHRFRQRTDTHSIPIILLTAYGYQPARTSIKTFEPDAYLAKPYGESELDDLIAMVLEARAKIEQAEEQSSSALQKKEPLVTESRVPRTAMKPDLKLVSNSGKLILLQPDPISGDAAAILTDKDRERRPALKVVPALRPAPALDGAPVTQPQTSLTVAPFREEETMVRASDLTPGPEVNPENAATEQSPLLTFRVAGNAVVDPATGLFGRPQFETMFSKEFKRAVRFKQQMSCMLINLDGHRLGRRADEALVKAIIGLVQKTIREVDTAAWWSGESFIVLLPNTIRRDALQAAARTLEAVATHPFTWPDATQVTMSIGVAGLPDKNIDCEQKMIEVADAACRRAQEFAVPPPFDVRSLKR
jgi:two-component system cell cycle response regulator